MDEVESRLRKVVESAADRSVGETPLATPWRDLGLDSLDLLGVIVACEDEFDVEIPDSVAVRLFSMEEMADYLSSAVEKAPP